MTIRLPVPGGDADTWGNLLNTFLGVELNADGTLNPNASLGTRSLGFVPTGVKTANYTASVADLIPVDISSGSVTVTLPSAPADKSRIAIKVIAVSGTNTCTVATSGGDVFNKSGGFSTITLSTLNQLAVLQYSSSTGIWYVEDGLTLASLDKRYMALSGPWINVKDPTYGAKGDGVTDDAAAIQAAIDSNNGAAVIFFPFSGAGYGISTSMIVDRDEVALVAEGGCFTTTIFVLPGYDPSFALIVGNTKTVKYCLLRNLTFKGRKDASTTGKGIQWYCSRGIVENVHIEQFGGSGFVVGGYSTDHINDHYMSGCYIEQCGYNASTNGDALVIQSGCYDSEYIRVICCGDAAKSTTRDGFNNSGTNQKFVACHAFYCSRYGFNHLLGPFEMEAGASETNANDNMQINGVNDFSVKGMQFYGSTAHKDLTLITATRGTIEACRFTSSTTDKNVFIGSTSQIVTFIGNITQNGSNPVQVDSTCTRIIVAHNQFQSSGDALIASTYSILSDNILTSCGITEQSGGNHNDIRDNIFYTAGKGVTKVGSDTHVVNHIGYVTEKSGGTTITSGNTSIAVTHNLSSTPTRVLLTPTTDTLGKRYWVSATSSTTFTITMDSSGGSDISFDWMAYVYDL